jgi:hypothetical protein
MNIIELDQDPILIITDMRTRYYFIFLIFILLKLLGGDLGMAVVAEESGENCHHRTAGTAGTEKQKRYSKGQQSKERTAGTGRQGQDRPGKDRMNY